ncbi:MAG TPA: ribonuclease III domain-containing protein [bacterium]|nr:ribonuclease III domain-containing protein [bacterium]
METFLRSLGIPFSSIEPYALAFVHRSAVNEIPERFPEHNERLEFLGDAVLELIITNRLFHDFPTEPEGRLTDIRSALVRGTNLGPIAERLGFPDLLVMSR